MLSLAISVALLTQQEPPRLRTICKNGAAILVERMADEPVISVQLWASARSVKDSKDTHGWRHLMEHLVARGQRNDLDKRLETLGCYLRARTFRHAMQFEIVVGQSQLKLAMSAIHELLQPLKVEQAQIDKELAIMREEYATYDNQSRLAAGAWNQAYGDAGLDPFGSLETMAKATPESLRELHRKHFYPENLVLTIAGPVDIKQATELATEFIGMRQGAIKLPDAPQAAGKTGRIEIEGFGEGRAAMVEGYDRPITVGSLAFALSIASGVEGSFVTYTPSQQRGLVIVGQIEKQAGIGLKIDGTTEEDLPRLFQIGKILARHWVERYLYSASGVAYIRGLLLSQSIASRPEAMIAAIEQLTFAQFKEAAHNFSKDRAVTVVGS